MIPVKNQLTLQEFLALPEGNVTYELVDGEAIAKISPKRFHSKLTGAIFTLLTQWCQNRGEVGIEWVITLTRNGQDWVLVPDLLYISYTRLPSDRILDEACPVAPELAIEIISPEKTFGEMTEKATDYLNAGVSRVWIVDPKAKIITVFYPDAPPQTKRGETTLADSLLEGLELTTRQVFQQAGLP